MGLPLNWDVEKLSQYSPNYWKEKCKTGNFVIWMIPFLNLNGQNNYRFGNKHFFDGRLFLVFYSSTFQASTAPTLYQENCEEVVKYHSNKFSAGIKWSRIIFLERCLWKVFSTKKLLNSWRLVLSFLLMKITFMKWKVIHKKMTFHFN